MAKRFHKVQKIILTIYIYGKKRALCEVEIPDESVVDNLIKDLKEKEIVRFGQVVIRSTDFNYATVEYK